MSCRFYLETVGNPRKFARLARRISRRKPVVAVMAAAATDVEAALLRQAGVVRVETVTELFDVAVLLASQPLPAGRRLAVVSDSAALARLVVSAAGSVGLACTDTRILSYGTPPRAYGQAVDGAVGEADAVLAILVPPVDAGRGETAAAVAQAAAGAGKPVLAAVMSYDGAPPNAGDVPSYPSPNSAVRALARAVEYAEFRSRPPACSRCRRRSTSRRPAPPPPRGGSRISSACTASASTPRPRSLGGRGRRRGGCAGLAGRAQGDRTRLPAPSRAARRAA